MCNIYNHSKGHIMLVKSKVCLVMTFSPLSGMEHKKS